MTQPSENMPGEHIPKVILLGNGIERSFTDVSWQELIEKSLIDNKSPYKYADIESMPANMQIVVATGNHVDQEMGKIKKTLTNTMLSDEHRSMYKTLCALKVDAILTTNYDYHIEQAMGCGHTESRLQKTRRWTKEVSKAEKRFNLYQYSVVDEAVTPPIWHIHGDVCRKDSMIMGHYYYGKLLTRVEKRATEFVRNFYSAKTKGSDCSYNSWVDWFLAGDVFIIGLGLYFSEVDLWWLLECKARNFPETQVHYYQPAGQDESDTRKLLSVYQNVVIHDYLPLVPTKTDSPGYIGYYRSVIQELRKTL